jgi:hypothetical protein
MYISYALSEKRDYSVIFRAPQQIWPMEGMSQETDKMVDIWARRGALQQRPPFCRQASIARRCGLRQSILRRCPRGHSA